MAGNLSRNVMAHNTLTTTWITKNSQGIESMWTTTDTRNEGESDSAFAARHASHVATDVAAHPIA